MSDDVRSVEIARLRALEKLGLLDTPEDDRFDCITALAAEWLDVPISLISFVDLDRQWFKSHHGLPVRETPRAIAFCAHAIRATDAFVVTDAQLDPRFCDNPLVTGPPFIRFYAGQPLVDDSGMTLGTLNILDRVPRRLSERQLHLLAGLARWAETEISRGEAQALRAAAVRAKQVKDQFLSRASHELRNPLNSILGYAQLLRLGELGPQETDEAIDIILSSGWHLLGLVDELLDCARIESGDIKLQFEAVDVKQAITEAVSSLQPQASQMGILLITPDERVGNGLAVLADRRRLLQILINLVSNAIKYNRPGGTVTVDATRGADELIAISVADTGFGIATHDLHRLFQPFDRLGAEERGIEGTGIGLSVCASLVDRMNGTITVRSATGTGSTFTVVLPPALPTAAGALGWVTPARGATIPDDAGERL